VVVEVVLLRLVLQAMFLQERVAMVLRLALLELLSPMLVVEAVMARVQAVRVVEVLVVIQEPLELRTQVAVEAVKMGLLEILAQAALA
jgi:hypothetical protein